MHESGWELDDSKECHLTILSAYRGCERPSLHSLHPINSKECLGHISWLQKCEDPNLYRGELIKTIQSCEDTWKLGSWSSLATLYPYHLPPWETVPVYYLRKPSLLQDSISQASRIPTLAIQDSFHLRKLLGELFPAGSSSNSNKTELFLVNVTLQTTQSNLTTK